jgi:5-methylcytosine-specific restriction endonuclease McrA
VCGLTINHRNFDAGHIIAKSNGGTDEISNLRPICSDCNGSMGTMNLEDFKKTYFPKKLTRKNEKATENKKVKNRTLLEEVEEYGRPLNERDMKRKLKV